MKTTKVYHHRYGKEQYAGASKRSTHRILIGLRVMRKEGGKVDPPSAVNGFYIARSTREQNKIVLERDPKDAKQKTVMLASEPDYAMMQALGFDRAKVDKALRLTRNAPFGMLPSSLEFVLLTNAARDEEGWDFSKIFTESYVATKTELIPSDAKLWNRKNAPGEFCRGNGIKAVRKMPDGTKKVIDCNPIGKVGMKTEEFCPYSRKTASPCKFSCGCTIALGKRDESKRLVPLASIHNASFRIATTSINFAQDVIRELEEAADALDGNILELPGTLSFSEEYMMTPEDDSGSARTPQISFSLNKWEISRRAREMREAQMTGRYLAAPRIAKLLEVTPTSEPTKGFADNEPTEDQMEDAELLDNEPFDDDEIQGSGAPQNSPEQEKHGEQAGEVAATESASSSATFSPVLVADAERDELLLALRGLIGNMQQVSGKTFEECCKEATTVPAAPDTGKDDWWTATLDAFGKGPRYEATLRLICQRHEDAKTVGFSVVRFGGG